MEHRVVCERISCCTWRSDLQTELTTQAHPLHKSFLGLRLLKAFALDVATGFGIFVFVLIAALVIHTIHYPALFLIVVSASLFAASYLRGAYSPLNPWLHGLIIGLGAAVPVVLLGKAFVGLTLGPMEIAILIVPSLVCGCGAQVQSFWKEHQRAPAFCAGIALLLCLVAGDKMLVPRILSASASKPMNKPAPPFVLTKLDGSEVSLASLKGRVVVLDFWGTWCAPCLAEMPAFDTLYNRYKSNPDVVFVLVNSGLNGDTPEKVRRFSEKRGLQIPVALDTTETAQSLGATLLPTFVILDKTGAIRLERSGFRDSNELQKTVTGEVEVLLASK